MNTRLEDIKLTWRGKVKKGEIAMYLDMRGVIETLPSAQHTGRWRPYPIAEDCWQCSECGVLRMGDQSNYCPNCGADMRGEQDEY